MSVQRLALENQSAYAANRRNPRFGTCGHKLRYSNPGPMCSACTEKPEEVKLDELPKRAHIIYQSHPRYCLYGHDTHKSGRYVAGHRCVTCAKENARRAHQERSR